MILLAAGDGLVDPATISTLDAPKIFFYIFAAIVLGGAVLTITRSNAVAAVMSLVATFFGLAAMYAMLSAHFLAALQVLVYAGAIMVLFIFVVMVLNKDEPEPWALRGIISKIAGAVALGYLVFTTISVFDDVGTQAERIKPEFGKVADVGEVLFTDYLFVFEAVSLLLLVAVIAAVVVARSHKTEEQVTEAAPITEEHA